MRLRLYGIHWAVSVLVILVFLFSAVFCGEDEGPFVYAVALERETPDQPSNLWSPTLYRISVPEGRITDRKSILPNGSPIYCRNLGKNEMSVAVAQGIASNGSAAGVPYPAVAKIMTINTNTMDTIDISVTDAQNDNLYEPTKPEREIYDLTEQTGLPSASLLHISPDDGKLYVLSGYSEGRPFLQVLERDSLREIQTVRIDAGERELGPAPDYRNAVLINDRGLICLFQGESSVGHFAPAYVMIADLDALNIRFVPIGSDPATGLAYRGD
ncbi:MAG: hypothetical protein ABIH23_30975 [bacterium]